MGNKPRLGVVAVVPFWSQSDNLNTDSNYAFLRLVLPEFVKRTEATLFLVFFPDPKYGADRWVYKDDGLQSERIRFYPWNYDTAMATSVTGWDNLRWKHFESEMGPNIYWLNQVEAGTFIHGGYSRSFNNTAQPCLVAQHHYIIHRSLPYIYESMFPRQWLQIGGSLASQRVVYNSQYCHRLASEAFGEYLGQDRMAQLEAKSSVLQFGLIRGDEPQAPEATASTRPVFLYNHRFESYKNPQITFGMFDALRKHFDFEVWATQTYGQNTKKYTYDKSMFAPSRAEYLQNVAVPAINTINSQHETFCISMLDSIALGHLVLVPNAVTFPELVPPDYPYVFKTEREQYEMAYHMLKNFPEEYNQWRTRLQDHARARFSLAKYADDYVALFEREEAAHREANRKPHLVEGVKKILASMERGKPYPIKKLRDTMSKAIWDSAGSSQSFPTRRAVRECLVYGGDDIDLVWQNGVHVVRR